MSDSRRPSLLLLGTLTAVYVAAGRLGLSLAFVNESASAVWPPTGIAIASLLLLGPATWPAVAAGAFLVNVSTSGIVASSAVIALGNTLEALAGAWLARRFANGVAAFDRPADVVRFALVAAVGASTIAASIGMLALLTAGLAVPGEAAPIWFTWWLGDAVGGIVVTPLVILWARPSTPSWHSRRWLETGAMAAACLLTSSMLFGPLSVGVSGYPLEFLLVPALLWPAFRFSSRETVIAAAAVAAVAIAGTLRGDGPFARGSPNESLLLLQSFIGVTTMVMLTVAAEVRRRHAIEDEMRALNDALERRVSARTDELRKVTERLLEAQQVARVGSWEWDIATNSLWWSEGLYRLFGLQAGNITTYEQFLSRVHPDDRRLVQDRFDGARADGRPFSYEHRIIKPDGSVSILHAAGRVMCGDDGRPLRMMGIGLDITERKQAEEERAELIRAQAARHEAEEMSRAKDEFLAVLSHELRTPLNAALGWAHMLRELPPGDPRTLRAVDAIYRNLFIQARLVSDIIDVSRIARGTLLLDKGPVDVPAVIEAAIDMVREAAASRQVVIQTHTPPEGVALVADAKRLQQVLWNLLSNAIKFGRDGGQIRISVAADAGTVDIVVEDDGPGIAPEFLPHVFDQFRQADASPRRRHEGLGLGLAIARHIVEQHGGRIVAANGPGGGAVFTIALPGAAVAQAAGRQAIDELQT